MHYTELNINVQAQTNIGIHRHASPCQYEEQEYSVEALKQRKDTLTVHTVASKAAQDLCSDLWNSQKPRNFLG